MNRFKIHMASILHVVGKLSTCLIASYALPAILTRYLGIGGFGNFVLTITYFSFFLSVVDFGLYVSSLKELARDKTSAIQILRNFLFLRLFISSLFIGLIGAWFVLNRSHGDKFLYFMIIALNYVPIAFIDTARCALVSHLKYIRSLVLDVSFQILLISWVALSVYQGWGLLWILFGYLIANCIVIVISIACVDTTAIFIPRFSRRVLSRIFKAAVPLGLSSIFAVIFFRIDVIMLEFLKNVNAVSVYGVAYRVLDFCVFVPSLIMTTLLPVFVEAHNKSKNSSVDLYHNVFKLMTYIAVPAIVGAMIIATPLVELISGSNFISMQEIELPFGVSVFALPTALTLQVLILAGGLMFWGQLNGHQLIVFDRENELIRLYYIAIPFNVVLNFIFIPRYSYLGAAFATVLSEFLALGYTTFVLFKHERILGSFKPLLLATVASVPMAIMLLSTDMPVIASIIAAVIVYGTIVLIFERQFFRTLLDSYLSFADKD